MIRTVIIDDEKNAAELVENMLGIYCGSVNVVGKADSVKSGFEMLTEMEPDLVFLDVQMGDGTGFDLLKKFDTIGFKVIFITAYQEYAINAFRYSAIDYLLKPVNPDHLILAVEKAEKTIKSEDMGLDIKVLLNNMSQPPLQRKKIVLKTADRIYVVNVDEITRCESDGSYTHVYLENGSRIMVSKLLKEFDQLLTQDGFVRVHQSHLVNLEYLSYFRRSENNIVMKDEASVPVSTRKKEELIQWLNNR